ncbi:MAG: DsbA family protein [Alphaproteobacteria bacterium]|nr:DsbA family protein [Alphaproteobacteria bacterium]
MARFVSIFIATLALIGVHAAMAKPPTTADALKDRIMGDPAAPIEIIDYSSMTCPHCRTFHTEILPALKKKYIDTGKARLVFRDFPFDRTALMASVLARCGPPKQYFNFLDVLFEKQPQWGASANPKKALTRIGKLGGLSESDYQACLDDKALIDGIVEYRLDGTQKYNVVSTPTFIITGPNGQETIVGAQPLEAFDEALKKVAN